MPQGRQALIGAIFARLDVLGFQRLEYELAQDAIDLGLDAALILAPRLPEPEGGARTDEAGAATSPTWLRGRVSRPSS